MGDIFFFSQGVLGASFVDQRDSSQLAWFVCGQKAQEGLESSSFTHLSDSMKSDESNGLR